LTDQNVIGAGPAIVEWDGLAADAEGNAAALVGAGAAADTDALEGFCVERLPVRRMRHVGRVTGLEREANMAFRTFDDGSRPSDGGNSPALEGCGEGWIEFGELGLANDGETKRAGNPGAVVHEL
jgi:hypothetical protein